MRFVRSPEDIARIDATLQNKKLIGRRLSVTFETDPAAVAAVLPPGLAPVSAPLVTARVSSWSTNYCGSFTMAGLYVPARHGDLEGEYILAMYIDNDFGLIIGREDFGEPKKLAEVEISDDGSGTFRGIVERGGQRLIDLTVTAGEDTGAVTVTGTSFSAKAQLRLGGGLQHDALLLAAYGESHVTVNRPGTGTLILGGNSHDPLDDFEVGDIVTAGYVECERHAHRNDGRPEELATIPAADFAPYHYGRLDDWTAHDTLTSAG